MKGTLWDHELTAFKRSLLEREIQAAGGNKAKAARALGIHEKYVRRLARELGLNRASSGGSKSSPREAE